MDFDSLAPVAELAGGLARRAVALDHASGRVPETQNPAEVLAKLLDFSGSVALAELLQAPAPHGPSHPEAAKLARRLQDNVQEQLDALVRRAVDRLEDRRAIGSMLDPVELHSKVERMTAERGRVQDPKVAARLARELGSPLRAALAASLRQAQADLASLRLDIARELRTLGPRASRLERIDAALQRSIQGKVGELFERLTLAAEQTFERACIYACAALPEGYGASELARWVEAGGWIERYRERCVRMAQAFCAHLRRGLEGLLLAAVDAETGVAETSAASSVVSGAGP